MKLLKLIIGLALLASGTYAMAESGWENSVEAGLLWTSGNTKTQSINVKGAAAHELNKWRNEAKLEALNVKGEEGRLSEKYLGSGKSSFKYSELSYSFVTADGEHDPFSGYAYQISSSLGYGYRVINKKTTTLDFEAGPGYRQTRLRGVDGVESEGVIRLSGKYVQKLSKTSTFSEELISAIGEDAKITKSVTALSAQVAGNLSMKASLTVNNNSAAPEGADKTDTETAVTLVYTF